MSVLTALPALTPFLTAAAFVTLNELGDKSQLLAIAFAGRMHVLKVLLGVGIATLANHGLAVATGTLLARVPGWDGWVRFFAALLFLVFAVAAVRPETTANEGPPAGRSRLGDVATVAFAFFFAEMGDKTQLATIALAARFSAAPLWVLAGAAVGMLLADGIGIAAGALLHRKLSAGICRAVSSALFLLFGLLGVYEACTTLFGFSRAGTGIIVLLAGACTFAAGSGLRRGNCQ